MDNDTNKPANDPATEHVEAARRESRRERLKNYRANIIVFDGDNHIALVLNGLSVGEDYTVKVGDLAAIIERPAGEQK